MMEYSDMEKVCFCLKMPHTSYVGGIAAIINSYIAGSQMFKSNGFDISVFDYQSDRIDKIKPTPLQTAIYGYAQYRELSKKIKNREIDILHIHTSCRTLFLKDVLLLSRLHKRYGVRAFISIHVGDISTVFEKIPSCVHYKLICLLNENTDKVCFLSDRMRKQFISRGLSKDHAALLYNFSDLDTSKNKNKKKGSKLNLLFVGMINRDKGILELLTALSEMKESQVHLDICGTITDTTIQDRFEELVRINKSKVTLHGYVNGEEKINIYNEADVLILPSYHEGLPLVILEALSSGCAIVSTPVGAISEILTDRNVRWLKVGSTESIKEVLEDLLRNPEEMVSVKEINCELGKKFSKKGHIESLCKLYKNQ